MTVTAVAGFWAVSLLLALVPGADWAYVIAAGLRDGSVLPAVAGLLTGYLALTAVVTAGVAGLIARSPAALTALTMLGAGYLLWLGTMTLLQPAAAPVAAAETGSQPRARRAARGAGVSGLNPKGLLLFLAILPPFATRGGTWPLAVQIAVLGLVHTGNCALVYTSAGIAARRVLRTRPGAAAAVTRCSGAAMIVLGALLLAGRLLR